MMGRIENGTLKKLRRFFARQQLPTKTEMCPFWSISLILGLIFFSVVTLIFFADRGRQRQDTNSDFALTIGSLLA
jgi:hypothetical protein